MAQLLQVSIHVHLKEQNWTIIFRIQLMWRHILALQKDNK